MKRIIGYKEALKRLKAGEGLNWIGGIRPVAYFEFDETVRWDTLHKLWQGGLITDYGYPLLHGTVKYKPAPSVSR